MRIIMKTVADWSMAAKVRSLSAGEISTNAGRMQRAQPIDDRISGGNVEN